MSLSTQLRKDSPPEHFLSIDGVEKDFLLDVLNQATRFASEQDLDHETSSLLSNELVVNLFFEDSTRTRMTFEIAAKRLGATVLSPITARLSTRKGETILDTAKTFESMGATIFVVRDSASGTPHLVANHLGEGSHVINAGDGRHAHPTQAILDIFTILQHKGDISRLRFAIVGDILHSRVARSQIQALNALGAKEVRVVAPKTLLPTNVDRLGATPLTNLDAGLEGVDVIMVLRLQLERMEGQLIPSTQEYFRCYGLTMDRLESAAPDVVVMHPGPINRGLEIASDVADSERSLILSQVSNGIAVRMAIMAKLARKRLSPE